MQKNKVKKTQKKEKKRKQGEKKRKVQTKKKKCTVDYCCNPQCIKCG